MQQIVPPRMAVQHQGGREPASRQGSKPMLGTQKQTIWLGTLGYANTPQEENWQIPCLPSVSPQARPEGGQTGSAWNNVPSLCLSGSWASLDPSRNLNCHWSAIQVPNKGSRSGSVRCPRKCIVYGQNLETSKLVTQRELCAKGIAGVLSSASSPCDSAALELEWQVVVENQADKQLRCPETSFSPLEGGPDLDDDGFVPVLELGKDDQDEVQLGDEASEDTSDGRVDQEFWGPDGSSMDDEQSRMFWNSVNFESFVSSEDPATQTHRTGSTAWWRTASREELAALVAQQAEDCLENCDLPVATTDAPHNVAGDSRFHGESSVWWRTAGKHELAALVAQKAASCLDNCDLPTPQSTSQQKKQTAPHELSTYELSLSESVNSRLMASLLHKDQQNQLDSLSLPGSLLNVVFGNSSSIATPESSHQGAEPAPRMVSSSCHVSQRPSSLTASWCVEEESSCLETEPELLGQALCHSQSRAREAEREARRARKAAEKANREKEQLAHMFCREAATLTYYRRRVTSLEAENFCLRTFYKSNPVWIENSTFNNPVKAQDRWSRNHWKNTGKEQHTVRCQFLKVPERKQSSIKLKSDGSCVVMESTVGLAFTLGLGLAGAGLMLGWSMR